MSKARKQLQERHIIERKALEEKHARERAALKAGERAAHRRQWQEEKRALEAEGFGLVLSFKGSGSRLKVRAQGSGSALASRGLKGSGGPPGGPKS